MGGDGRGEERAGEEERGKEKRMTHLRPSVLPRPGRCPGTAKPGRVSATQPSSAAQ